MTTLVGLDNITGFTSGKTISVPSRVLWQAYTAASSGTASTIAMYMNNGSGSTAEFKLGIWDSSGSLLAATGVLNMVGAEGWISGAIGVSITASTVYWLGIMRNAEAAGYPRDIYWLSDGTTDAGIYIDDTGTYPTVTATIADGGGLGAGDLPIYIDGTAGGGSIVPQAMANYRMRAA